MKRFLSLISMVLALFLISSSLPPSAAAAAFYRRGDKIQDFTFSTYDGQLVTLSEVLKEKEAVLINIWASWCGPCRSEFPFMQEAYTSYQDRVEVLALSCEPTDTADTLAAFAESYQLTFKIGQDPVGFLAALGVNSIPTTLMIDRFGTICYVHSGAMPNVDSFTRLFDAFLGENYTESVLLDAIPPKQPDVLPSSEAELTNALGTGDHRVRFMNPSDSADWPMVVTEKDGRSVVASSNRNIEPSRASLISAFSAEAGDALVITFKMSSEPVHDAFQLWINGKLVKSFAGNEAWQTYAYAIEADGDYEAEIAYVKNAQGSSGDDMLWVDSITLVSGEDTFAALAQNPRYPVSDEIGISVLNENARSIIVDDPTGNVALRYGDSAFYLLPDDRAHFAFSMVEGYDPETAIVYFNYDGRSYALSDCLEDGQYIAYSGGDSITTTGYCDSSVILYPDPYTVGTILTYFKSETDVNTFLAALTADSDGTVQGSWRYAEPESAADVDAGIEDSQEISYTIRCVDQDGQPVSGAMLQVCDAETCMVLRSDDLGICSFAGAPYAWEIHVLKSPEGYSPESSQTVYAPLTGGEITFTFIKN